MIPKGAPPSSEERGRGSVRRGTEKKGGLILGYKVNRLINEKKISRKKELKHNQVLFHALHNTALSL